MIGKHDLWLLGRKGMNWTETDIWAYYVCVLVLFKMKTEKSSIERNKYVKMNLESKLIPSLCFCNESKSLSCSLVEIAKIRGKSCQIIGLIVKILEASWNFEEWLVWISIKNTCIWVVKVQKCWPCIYNHYMQLLIYKREGEEGV